MASSTTKQFAREFYGGQIWPGQGMEDAITGLSDALDKVVVSRESYNEVWNLAKLLSCHLTDEIKKSGNPSEATLEILEQLNKFFGPEE